MNPAIDPKMDYKALVRKGYDTCAQAYDKSRKAEAGAELLRLRDRLHEGDAVLDIGCGAGVPIAKALAERFNVTGVDLSREMIRRAQQNVPTGNFTCADIMSLRFPPASFSAVVAFYSIFHLPREEHSLLFRRIHRWLAPGGLFLCTLSHFSEEGYTEDGFFSVTMYWSNYRLSGYIEILSRTGFMLVQSESTGSGYAESAQEFTEDHPLVLAQKR